MELKTIGHELPLSLGFHDILEIWITETSFARNDKLRLLVLFLRLKAGLLQQLPNFVPNVLRGQAVASRIGVRQIPGVRGVPNALGLKPCR
jgi:hypothetical protein